MLPQLFEKVAKLKEKGITPSIAIVTLGPEETWEAYVGQKIKMANRLQIEAKLIRLKPETTRDVLQVIDDLNSDPAIHGLIVQRPFPIHIDTERIIQSVSKYKDIDGFRNDSNFEVPVFLAVKQILTHISQLIKVTNFEKWLLNQSILVIGKGETAGQPVISGLKKLGLSPQVMDSKAQSREELFKKADILIFATGKRIDVPYKMLKKNSILIGIGLHKNEDGLKGDFDENEARNNVLYYTPSPGGVGPLNLFFLFDNLLHAASVSLDRKY